MFDQTSFSKASSPGGRRTCAAVAVHRRCGCAGGRVGWPPEMLNERGTYEVRRHRDRNASGHRVRSSARPTTERDKDHIRPGTCPCGARAELVDVTSALAVFGVMGPRSLTCWPPLTDSADLSDAALPVRHQPADRLGCATCGNRITGVGELGLGALRSRRVRGRGVRGPTAGRGTLRSGNAAATTPSSRCGWRRATAPSAVS